MPKSVLNKFADWDKSHFTEVKLKIKLNLEMVNLPGKNTLVYHQHSSFHQRYRILHNNLVPRIV